MWNCSVLVRGAHESLGLDTGNISWVSATDIAVDGKMKDGNQTLTMSEKMLTMNFMTYHYVNVSVLINFSQKTSVFTLIIISSP